MRQWTNGAITNPFSLSPQHSSLVTDSLQAFNQACQAGNLEVRCTIELCELETPAVELYAVNINALGAGNIVGE